jgi:hypothetical protein
VSLLDSGQIIDLYPDEWARDDDGNRVRVPGSTALPIVGRWQYLVPTEDNSDGQIVGTTATFLCRRFPSGFAGRASYDGRDWDVVGDPIRSGLTAATRHVKVRLRAREARPVGG